MATGTFPTATMSSTTLATSIPLIWGDKINEFFILDINNKYKINYSFETLSDDNKVYLLTYLLFNFENLDKIE